MSALSYLFLTTIKNRIKQLKNNPAQLVLNDPVYRYDGNGYYFIGYV